MDRAELRAFDLPRDRAELARRINLDLDAAAGILLDGGAVGFGIDIERRIERRRRDLHREGLVLRLRRPNRQRHHKRAAAAIGPARHCLHEKLISSSLSDSVL